jgi:hypothetical protein
MNPVLFKGAVGTLLFSLAGWSLGAVWIYKHDASITPTMHANLDLRECIQDKDNAALAHLTMGAADVKQHNRFVAECTAQVQAKYHDATVPALD